MLFKKSKKSKEKHKELIKTLDRLHELGYLDYEIIDNKYVKYDLKIPVMKDLKEFLNRFDVAKANLKIEDVAKEMMNGKDEDYINFFSKLELIRHRKDKMVETLFIESYKKYL